MSGFRDRGFIRFGDIGFCDIGFRRCRGLKIKGLGARTELRGTGLGVLWNRVSYRGQGICLLHPDINTIESL